MVSASAKANLALDQRCELALDQLCELTLDQRCELELLTTNTDCIATPGP
jgi:hypothetical protein